MKKKIVSRRNLLLGIGVILCGTMTWILRPVRPTKHSEPDAGDLPIVYAHEEIALLEAAVSNGDAASAAKLADFYLKVEHDTKKAQFYVERSNELKRLQQGTK